MRPVHLPPPPPGSKVIDTGLVRFWLGSDGIIYDETYMKGHIEGEHMRRGLAAIRELTHGRPTPLIAVASRIASASPEARAVLTGKEATALISGMAVVITNPVVRIVMNFARRVAPPPYPMELFDTLESAQAWAASLPVASSTRETLPS
jgi:hypothetical protein